MNFTPFKLKDKKYTVLNLNHVISVRKEMDFYYDDYFMHITTTAGIEKIEYSDYKTLEKDYDALVEWGFGNEKVMSETRYL